VLAWLLRAPRTSAISAPDEALPVATAIAFQQSMPVLVEAVGEVISRHSVQIRPQITGTLRRVCFSEGQEVVAGQRLFEIDPAVFTAAAAAARAAWESARANAERLPPLAKQGYVTPQDLLNARSATDQAEAAYKQAAINLSYTQLRAPIAGRTGVLSRKAGNIVAPSDAAPLVTINEIRPIEVQFSIPQQTLGAVRQQLAAHAISVRISSEDGAETLDEGVLGFIDNTVNAQTGTILLKARTPNRSEQLWPGEYVGVHMELRVEPRAIVVPATAVQTGQEGPYVFLVTQGAAVARTVRVDREVGVLAVISSGLTAGQRVITRVPRGLRAGMRVRPQDVAVGSRATVTVPESP